MTKPSANPPPGAGVLEHNLRRGTLHAEGHCCSHIQRQVALRIKVVVVWANGDVEPGRACKEEDGRHADAVGVGGAVQDAAPLAHCACWVQFELERVVNGNADASLDPLASDEWGAVIPPLSRRQLADAPQRCRRRSRANLALVRRRERR